jgi:hypothetical protein
MLRYLFGKMLESFHRRYNYDIRYQQEILATDKAAFLKWMAFQTMAAHAGQLPVAPLFAARLRAIIAEDCGPCTQLVVDLALEAKLAPELISAIITRDLDKLPADIQLVVNFCDLVLARQPQANDLRAAIRARWGQSGLIAIGFAISSYRVYPTLKYSLGYGETCRKVMVKQTPVLIHKANPTSQ